VTHLLCNSVSKFDDFGTNGMRTCDFLLYSVVVTFVLSCTVSSLRQLIGWKLLFFLPLFHSVSPLLCSL